VVQLREIFVFEGTKVKKQMTKIKEKKANEQLGQRQIHSHCEYHQLEKCQRLFNDFHFGNGNQEKTWNKALNTINIHNNNEKCYTTIEIRRICQIEVEFWFVSRCKLLRASLSSTDALVLISFSRRSTLLWHLPSQMMTKFLYPQIIPRSFPSR
jgi:hypothetical protein